MRKCIRCGNQMKEGGAIKVEGSLYPIIVFANANSMFKGRMGTP